MLGTSTKRKSGFVVGAWNAISMPASRLPEFYSLLDTEGGRLNMRNTIGEAVVVKMLKITLRLPFHPKVGRSKSML